METETIKDIQYSLGTFKSQLARAEKCFNSHIPKWKAVETSLTQYKVAFSAWTGVYFENLKFFRRERPANRSTESKCAFW